MSQPSTYDQACKTGTPDLVRADGDSARQHRILLVVGINITFLKEESTFHPRLMPLQFHEHDL